MKNSKLLLVAFAVSVSTTSFANSNPKFLNEKSVASAVSQFVAENICETEKDLKVTIFFSISEDKKMQSVSVASQSDQLNQLLEEKLENQELRGDAWRMGKVYELRVVQKARV